MNNATKAVPIKGGVLAIRSYSDGEWAFAEITNSGQITEEDRLRILQGEGQGRGLYITFRIVRLLNGRIEIEGGNDKTAFLVRFPLYQPQKDR